MVDYSKWERLEVSGDSSAEEEETPGHTSAPSRGVVDYSKWEKLQVDEEDEAEKPRVRVRKLETSDSVTVGPDGVSIHRRGEAPASAASSSGAAESQERELESWIGEERQREAEEEERLGGLSFEDAHEWPRCGNPCAVGSSLEAEDSSSRAEETSLLGEKANPLLSFVRNGGVVAGRYFWKQSRGELTAWILLPDGTRGKHLSVSIQETRLEVKAKRDGENGHETLLEGLFQHAVDDSEDSWIWQVVRLPAAPSWKKLQEAACPRRTEQPTAQQKNAEEGESRDEAPKPATFLEIQLRKKPPLPQVDVWWSAFLRGEPEIDVASIADRRASAQSFRDAWREAHDLFAEKVKRHKAPTLV